MRGGGKLYSRLRRPRYGGDPAGVGGVGRLDVRAGPGVVQPDRAFGPGRQKKTAGRRYRKQSLVCHQFGLEAAQLGVPDLNTAERIFLKKPSLG